MTASLNVSDAPAARQPGRMSRAVIRRLMKQTRVVEAEPLQSKHWPTRL